jgi:hypothetical protein
MKCVLSWLNVKGVALERWKNGFDTPLISTDLKEKRLKTL